MALKKKKERERLRGLGRGKKDGTEEEGIFGTDNEQQQQQQREPEVLIGHCGPKKSKGTKIMKCFFFVR